MPPLAREVTVNRWFAGGAAAFIALTPALVQAEPVQTFRLKNATTELVVCRIALGDSNVDISIRSGKKWQRKIAADEVVVSCNPPVKQLGYRMTGELRYSFLRSEVGGEIEIVSVTQ